MLDALWRAVAYCLHPRVMWASLLPVLLAGTVAGGLAWRYWEPAVAGLRGWLAQWPWLNTLMQWLESVGAGAVQTLMAPVLLVALAVPVVVLVTLLLVAAFMTPGIVKLVAERRFPDLERRHGAAWWQGVLWSLVCTAAAVLALLVSLPLWFVPPFVLLLPPLIWGWLSGRIFSFDVLADHASAAERRMIAETHRWPLLLMGVFSGYLGALPSIVWAFGAMSLVLAPVMLVLSVWLYTLVFAFSACWYAHYALAALARLRQQEAATRVPGPVVDLAGSADPSPPPASPTSPASLSPADASPPPPDSPRALPGPP
ncbi:MAG: EI24 domain-containing protein [Rubrivivax sp.]|jgi:hypothetical protein